MTTLPLYLVDAFCAGPFTGNPAAVCVLDQTMDDKWMQSVAAELQQAETAFVMRDGDAWQLRWFTPTVEVDLCGHATLATAAALWERGDVQPDAAIRFHTRSGELVALRDANGIALALPAFAMAPVSPPDGLLEALGVQPLSIFKASQDYIVEVFSADDVRLAAPDLPALATIPCRGVGITAAGSDGIDVISRFFAPGCGIPEDPVTGSFHCALGPFWCKRLRKTTLRCEQASPRGGQLIVMPMGQTVKLIGQTRIVFSGSWHV